MGEYKQPYTISNIEIQRNDNQLTIRLANASKSEYQLYVGREPEAEKKSINYSLPVQQVSLPFRHR